jgi:hypothetical protein
MSNVVKKLNSMSTYNAVETAIDRAKSSPRETWEQIVKRGQTPPVSKPQKAESKKK